MHVRKPNEIEGVGRAGYRSENKFLDPGHRQYSRPAPRFVLPPNPKTYGKLTSALASRSSSRSHEKSPTSG